MSRPSSTCSIDDPITIRSPDPAPDVAALQALQRRRKRVLRLGVLILLMVVAGSQSLAHPESQLHDMIEAVGLCAIGLCIFGRGWCSLYIGGRKTAELVTTGPYSSCRNPLYVFSMIGAFGAGVQTGSVVIGLVFAVACWWVFRGVVLREEAVLAERFGAAFTTYRNTLPRFRPTWFRWHAPETLQCKPALFLTTTRDALWFLAAIPVFEGIKVMQDEGWLIPLIQLP